MSKTIAQIEQELDAKIPGSVVCERDGGGGRKLSYLEGHYVIDRLNKIFGPTKWDKEITDVRLVTNTTSRGEFPAYLVKVRLTVSYQGEQDKYRAFVIKEAYGYGADKSSQNAHELAIKEAVTDALKVAAKDLGMSLGLALYDKEQVNVDYEDEKAPARESTMVKPAQRAESPKGSEASSSKVPSQVSSAPSGSNGNTPRPDKVRDLIRSYVNAAIKRGVLTMPDMKKYLQDNHKADTLDGVQDSGLDTILTHVKGLS